MVAVPSRSRVRVPFNRITTTGTEAQYIAEALKQGHVSGDGPFSVHCHDRLRRLTDARKVLLTTSCTHALEMAALLLDLDPGDEVLVPSFTFVSTVNAFVLRGAKPVFVDIRPDTLNLDERQVERLIGPRTRAIVPVHYGGVACEMDALLEIAARRGIAVVEDNAHGLFGRYRGRPLGSLGALATLSFHQTKNITCGEGGALLINDPALFERAEILRNKGTNRSNFLRGEVDKYTWVDLGSSYLPSDVLSAYLLAQLDAHSTLQARRCLIWQAYRRELSSWAETHDVRFQHVPEHCEVPAHLFALLLPSEKARDGFLRHLVERGVQAVSHYMPLHESTMGRTWGATPEDAPVTSDVSRRLARLPLFADLTDDELGTVIEAVLSWSA